MRCAIFFYCAKIKKYLSLKCSIQYYVIKFVSDFRQVGGFFGVLRFPPSIKLKATI